MSVDGPAGFYECGICGLHYVDKSMAERCEEYCRKHKACSISIAKHSVEMSKRKK